MQEFPNYIQKMLDEYNAKNPPEVLTEKNFLRDEIVKILQSLNSKADPVFKEFADNPLAAKRNDELEQEKNDFIDKANANLKICKPAKDMILRLCDMHIYRSFCGMENVLRNKNLAFENLIVYDFIVEDLVDCCYEVKKNMDISTKDLLLYTYYLGFKDFVVTLFIPTLKYLAKQKQKFHLNLSKRKRNSNYKAYQAQKDFILSNPNLSNMYKYFLSVYKENLTL